MEGRGAYLNNDRVTLIAHAVVPGMMPWRSSGRSTFPQPEHHPFCPRLNGAFHLGHRCPNRMFERWKCLLVFRHLIASGKLLGLLRAEKIGDNPFGRLEEDNGGLGFTQSFPRVIMTPEKSSKPDSLLSLFADSRLLKPAEGLHMECAVKNHPALDSVMHLLPENVLVSGGENIPGLVASPTGNVEFSQRN